MVRVGGVARLRADRSLEGAISDVRILDFLYGASPDYSFYV